MRHDLFATSVDDDRTRQTIRAAWEQHHLLLEPHGAVAWRGLLDWEATERRGDSPAVVLETAHPAKFPEELERVLGSAPPVPPALAALDRLTEDYDQLPVDYDRFQEYLVGRYGPT